MRLDLLSTLAGSMVEGFYPSGWDLKRIDACCGHPPESIFDRQPFWDPDFQPIGCDGLSDFEVMLGHEIAQAIQAARLEQRPLAIIFPVGPMGMYRWTVYFLKQWSTSCDHVWGFNMDEWSDALGNTLAPDQPGSFQLAMEEALYGPLGKNTVPIAQRFFATARDLPTFAPRIEELRKQGARLLVVYGIGRVFHIAFWEPHFAGEYASEEEWRRQTHRIAAKLHPLTIEQNAITSFKSRTTLVPARANTIGPALFLNADWAVGGCDGALSRGMMWQGMSLWTTLRHGPSPWIPSSMMPTRPGRLYFLRELAGPLVADCH